MVHIYFVHFFLYGELFRLEVQGVLPPTPAPRSGPNNKKKKYFVSFLMANGQQWHTFAKKYVAKKMRTTP